MRYELYCYLPSQGTKFFGATDDKERLIRWMNQLHNRGYYLMPIDTK